MCSMEKGGWKCVECKQYLCNNCKVTHLKVPLCKKHHIVPAEETATVIDRPLLCKKHNDQTIILNCRECEELLCIKCKVTDHNKHGTETIDDTLKRVLPEMDGYCDKIKQLIADIDMNKDTLKTRKDEIRAAFSRCHQDAKIKLQKIVDRATEDYNALVKELEIREEEEVDKIGFIQNQCVFLNIFGFT